MAKHRTAEEQERFRKLDAARAAEAAAKAARPNLFRKPELDEMGADGATPVKKPLFAKPSLDDMGPGTDAVTPAGAVSRSLFKKQSAPKRTRPTPSRRRCARSCSARTRSTR